MKKLLCFLLACSLLVPCLAGCSEREPNEPVETAAPSTESSIFAAPDGEPGDVTCKGDYSGEPNTDTIVARCGSGELTLGTLQSLYALEVLEYLNGDNSVQPDASLPFSQQPCQIDSSVNTWQQYFLKNALSTWHTAQALSAAAEVEGLPVEEAFQPNLDNYAEYMTGMPATKYMYRYESGYTPNSMHQAYLDSLEDLLSQLAGSTGFANAEVLAAQGLHTTKDSLLAAAKLYNFGYMYLTTMEDYLVPTAEEVDSYYQAYQSSFSSETGRYADIRHILFTVNSGASEERWDAVEAEAEKERAGWAAAYKSGEGSFGQLAHDISDDKGSYLQGGSYWHVSQGELIPQLDEWVFDAERQPGDSAVIRSDLGVHILYYADGNTKAYATAKDALTFGKLQEFVDQCLEQYPMEVTYADITLAAEPESGLELSYSDLLYPDIAHERFPEVPLYLQQDYGVTRYGNYPLRTYGCGITSLSMLSSYMTDTELTPPILCQRYGSYCSDWGTDYTIFRREPPNMGYYLREQVFDPSIALAALEDGYILVACEQKGYWTKTAHYIVIEKIDEKGVQVRDSNIYNYKRIPAHAVDRHTWDSIKDGSASFWVYEKKPVRSALCARCGDPENYSNTILTRDYLCKRCTEALVRRNFYLGL